MYAIIRAGGKQAKVQSGDILEIERVKSGEEKLTFAPLLVVDDDGNALSDKTALAKASVTAKVLGETAGEKIDIFKYKSKSGYRRRQGHRQKYTRIEITNIKLPAAAKKKPAAEKKQTAAKKPAAAKKQTAAKKTTEAKKPAAKKAAAKTEEE
jgi:large subunit ribosomal protein L21